MDLKIFVQDHGVYGMLVVVAKCSYDARVIMKSSHTYSESEPLEIYDIKEGLSIVNYGDI